MILFLGDSFTWGQGLQYINLTNKKGWTWEECSKIVPPKLNLEWLGFEEDEFRKINSFPYLVARKLDLPFNVCRFENGGDNQTIYQMINDMTPFCTTNNVFCLVIQFSDASRSLHYEYEPSLGSIENQIENQVKRISKLCDIKQIPWVGLSWQPEIGDILKNNYSDNYIPIIYNEVEYSNFSTRHSGLADLFLNFDYPIDDQHFNLKGHKIIADLIYNKIMSRKDLIGKLNYYKTEIKNKKEL